MRNPKNPLAGFRLRGNPTTWGKLPALIQKIQGFLDRLPSKELVRMRSISEGLGVSEGTINKLSTHPSLSDYRHHLKYNDVVWGSSKTIAELRRRLDGK